ncbi:MAG: DUF4230 domain-containing protein [Clostridium sp.]|nr:DUF4230 domain-containing protein [Clostridium sp.]
MRRLLPLIMLAGLLSGASCSSSKEPESTPDSPIELFSELHDIQRLELASMTVNKVGTISDLRPEDARSFGERARTLMNKLKIGDRIGVYSFDTHISAYIDLTTLRPGDVDLDTAARALRVILPPVSVSIDGRDATLTELHHRVSGLRSELTPEERALLKEQMSARLLEEIRGDSALLNRLKLTAESKARALVTAMAVARGYSAEVSFDDN